MITMAAVMMIKMTDKDEHRITIKTSLDVQSSSSLELLSLSDDFVSNRGTVVVFLFLNLAEYELVNSFLLVTKVVLTD